MAVSVSARAFSDLVNTSFVEISTFPRISGNLFGHYLRLLGIAISPSVTGVLSPRGHAAQGCQPPRPHTRVLILTQLHERSIQVLHSGGVGEGRLDARIEKIWSWTVLVTILDTMAMAGTSGLHLLSLESFMLCSLPTGLSSFSYLVDFHHQTHP